MGKRRDSSGQRTPPRGVAALGGLALEQARRLMADGKYAEALEWLGTEAAKGPEAARLASEVHYRYGTSLAAHGMYRDAERHFARVVASNGPLATLAQSRHELARYAGRALRDVGELRARFGDSCGRCRAEDLYAVAVCEHQRAPVPPAKKLHPAALRPLLEETYAAAAYRSGWDLDRNHPMSVLMRQEKQQINDVSLRLLGVLLADFVCWHTPLAAKVDVVVPVPTSRDRVAARGGSIPGGLAATLRDRLALPLREPLVQVALHLDHTQAHGEVRRRGLRAAWRLEPDGVIVGRSVLLVDDILTTGTTLTTAAEMLKEAGAACVYAAALMHTERST